MMPANKVKRETDFYSAYGFEHRLTWSTLESIKRCERLMSDKVNTRLKGSDSYNKYNNLHKQLNKKCKLANINSTSSPNCTDIEIDDIKNIFDNMHNNLWLMEAMIEHNNAETGIMDKESNVSCKACGDKLFIRQLDKESPVQYYCNKCKNSWFNEDYPTSKINLYWR